MKQGPKTPAASKQAAEILRILIVKLPDEILRAYFKDKEPRQVRKILTEAIAILAPREEKAALVRSQAKLWQTGEKDWQGKLVGEKLLLFTDGASRGNPGEAGAGVAIMDESGNELVGTCKYLGKCTNNEAEYRALLFGLAKCAELGHGRLKVHLDSELIVKQIRGEYKVKHPNLKEFFQETMRKLAEFASFEITHVRREKNSRADELANRAIDEH